MKEYPLYIKSAVYLFLIIMIVFVMLWAKFILIPVSIGILLTFLLMPISRWLENKGIPRILAILMSIILMILVLGGFIYFLSNQIMSFSEDLPILKEKVTARFAELQQYVSDRFNISEKRQIAWMETQLLNALQSSGQLFGNIFSATGTFIAASSLIPIYIFFFTLYKYKFVEFIKHLTDPEKHDWILNILHRTSQVSQKYLVGLVIDITILSILNSIGFMILGIDHAVLLGVIAGVLNIIPYVGVLIGSMFPIAMAFLTKDSSWIPLGAFFVCLFVQFLDNNFITPKVVGSSVSINPLATLIVLLIGASIWGIAGMMLFIPYLGMLKVVFDHVDHLRPFGFLIGEEVKFKGIKKTFFTRSTKQSKKI